MHTCIVFTWISALHFRSYCMKNTNPRSHAPMCRFYLDSSFLFAVGAVQQQHQNLDPPHGHMHCFYLGVSFLLVVDPLRQIRSSNPRLLVKGSFFDFVYQLFDAVGQIRSSKPPITHVQFLLGFQSLVVCWCGRTNSSLELLDRCSFHFNSIFLLFEWCCRETKNLDPHAHMYICPNQVYLENSY